MQRMHNKYGRSAQSFSAHHGQRISDAIVMADASNIYLSVCLRRHHQQAEEASLSSCRAALPRRNPPTYDARRFARG